MQQVQSSALEALETLRTAGILAVLAAPTAAVHQACASPALQPAVMQNRTQLFLNTQAVTDYQISGQSIATRAVKWNSGAEVSSQLVCPQ